MDDTKVIFKVDTTDAVKSVADLRNNISAYKERLKDLEIGSKDYQKTLSDLQVNQKALKDAMYATTASMEEVAANAKGLNVQFDSQNRLVAQGTTSYNALVSKMAELKAEWRSTSDVVKRAELGKKIDEINTELKTMDASVGNFSRNVGNYQSVFKGFAEKTDAIGKGFKVATGGVEGFKNGFEALSKSPGIATFSILAGLAVKIVGALQENETAMESIKGALSALKPLMDFFEGILENVISYLADIITKVAEFVSSNGIIDKVIKGVMGIGNAIVQSVIKPFKAIGEAFKVLKEKGIKGMDEAKQAFTDSWSNSGTWSDFKQAGEQMAEKLASGVKKKKKDIEDTGKEVGESFAKGLEKAVDDTLRRLERRQDQYLKDLADTTDMIDEEWENTQAEIDDITAETTDTIFNNLKAQVDAEKEAAEEEAKIAQARVDTLFSVANATSSILGSIADMYEADEKNAEKNAKKVKALRIMAATIDTISGAVGAFMQASATLPPPYGQIVGAITAASVTAAGIAQIAQMKSTSTSGSSSVSSPSASVSAPLVNTNVTNVRSVTTASEEERLNNLASNQKVYILSSDIEASQNQRKVQVNESSF